MVYPFCDIYKEIVLFLFCSYLFVNKISLLSIKSYTFETKCNFEILIKLYVSLFDSSNFWLSILTLFVAIKIFYTSTTGSPQTTSLSPPSTSSSPSTSQIPSSASGSSSTEVTSSAQSAHIQKLA